MWNNEGIRKEKNRREALYTIYTQIYIIYTYRVILYVYTTINNTLASTYSIKMVKLQEKSYKKEEIHK